MMTRLMGLAPRRPPSVAGPVVMAARFRVAVVR